MQIKRWNFKFEASFLKTLNLKFWSFFLESKKFYIWSYRVYFGDALRRRDKEDLIVGLFVLFLLNIGILIWVLESFWTRTYLTWFVSPLNKFSVWSSIRLNELLTQPISIWSP